MNFHTKRDRPPKSPSWPVSELPRVGYPGSRSAELHLEHPDNSRALNYVEQQRFVILRWMGTVGALLMGLGALGAGAFPVVNNPYRDFPLGTLMARMLTTSSIVTLLGVGFLVLAWVLMGPFVTSRVPKQSQARVSMTMLRRTYLAWVVPIALTAPMFTQDIYSYLAQGSIVARGLDPYSGGPVDLLGPEADIARSVPFIWAHSPSPYGPVALGLASAISRITQDSIVLGVFAHRFLAVLGLSASAWAIVKLARRCHVNPQAAMWLGVLNPLCLLHLIGGIHNESVLLGLLLIGMEIGLRGVDRLNTSATRAWLLILSGSALITCAGLVKVTGFIALGFVGMAIARHLIQRGRSPFASLVVAGLSQLAALIITTATITWISGIPLGWVTGQGGAATIRSWMSITTDIGVISGWLGMLLDLGDHTEHMLSVTRATGVVLAAAFMVRMLYATGKGYIHPVGGLGMSTFVLVLLFPVLHPWYMLWAILPLAAWANRPLFRMAVVGYSALFSFFVLPRGLALPAVTIVSIYVGAAIIFVGLLAALWWMFAKRRGAWPRMS
ncbi:polyprenol phosphomannose-dependent alpha 1,6 mannosyltransferase MptB [Staphylococcus chromogenes]|nr:polyprenol phosphomannose-dependent alpha 1,6 mannosyltransferase MptB [Staphylococcus chromogenes]